MSHPNSRKKRTTTETVLLLSLTLVLILVVVLGAFVRLTSPSRVSVPEPTATELEQTEETTLPTEALPFPEAEAKRVSEVVQGLQTDKTFSFFAISDVHENEQYSENNEIMGKAAALIRDTVEIDFAALLGDITTGDSTTTIEGGIAHMETVSQYLDDAYSGIPNFRTVGNHDILTYSYAQNEAYLDNEALYPYIGAYNTGAVNAEDPGGYCYRDFEEYKTRVILLNTSDMDDVVVTGSQDYIQMSSKQLQWFAESLDLSEKPDAAQWGILILSHVPLDFGSLVDSAGKILHAYLSGTSISFTWEGSPIRYEYEGKNAPEIIANIHGHSHCFLAENMYVTTQDNAMYRSPIVRICIPNACVTRNNERGINEFTDSNGIEFGETETYKKTLGTAEFTSFNVVTIDREKKIIHCTNFGAGYDREIPYTEPIASAKNPFASESPAPAGTYTNLVPSALALVKNDKKALDGVGYRNHTYLSNNVSPYGHDAECVITGAIPYQVPSYGIPSTIYIWGATLDGYPHVRFFIFDGQKNKIVLHAAGEEIAQYFTIEKLGDQYYKLTPIPRDDDSLLYPATNGRAGRGYIAFSLRGVGENLVVTMDEPIVQE